MDCAEAKLRIEPYVTGELPAEEKEPLETHLAGCAECRLDSELTRASRNPPTGPGAGTGGTDPDAAPADFVESIQPKAPDATASSGPGPGSAGESWTLEGIFGAGGAGGAGGPGEAAEPGAAGPPVFAEPAAPSAPLSPPVPPAAPEPTSAEARAMFDDPPPALRSSEPPALRASAPPAPREPELPRDLPHPEVLHRPVPITRDEPPPSDAPSWDFEPADAKSGRKPPEGSLFFAEEALSRSSEKAARRKAATSRRILWGAGGLFGVALLVASIWIAMTVQKPLPATIHPRPMEAESLATPAPAPVSSEAQEPSEASAIATTADAALSTPPQAVAPPPADTPAPSAASNPTSSHPLPAKPTPPARATRANLAPKSAPTTQRTPSAPSTVAKAPAPVPSRTTAMPRDREVEVWDEDEPAFPQRPQTTSPSTSQRSPAATTSPKAPTTTAPPAVPAPVPPPSTVQQPSAGAPATSASGDVQRPIDRLHLATLTAEQNADLPALRKLREAWRGFVKSSIGPERARAKRELADCLWAVQTLTARASDQKEALAAYRDYVLNAPAGGADSRTVARMRQLEDALTEHR